MLGLSQHTMRPSWRAGSVQVKKPERLTYSQGQQSPGYVHSTLPPSVYNGHNRRCFTCWTSWVARGLSAGWHTPGTLSGAPGQSLWPQGLQLLFLGALPTGTILVAPEREAQFR